MDNLKKRAYFTYKTRWQLDKLSQNLVFLRIVTFNVEIHHPSTRRVECINQIKSIIINHFVFFFFIISNEIRPSHHSNSIIYTILSISVILTPLQNVHPEAIDIKCIDVKCSQIY